MAVICAKLLALSLALLAIGVINVDAQINTCVICDSWTDLNCILAPNNLPSVACQTANPTLAATCHTRFSAGRVQRLCAPDAVACTGTECLSCLNENANACNRQVVPQARRSCVQCEGGHNSTCGWQQFVSQPCQNHQDTECFTRRSNRLVTRGCGTEHRGLCDNRGDCLWCGDNGCNTLAQSASQIPMANAGTLLTVAPVLVLGAVGALLKSVL